MYYAVIVNKSITHLGKHWKVAEDLATKNNGMAICINDLDELFDYFAPEKDAFDEIGEQLSEAAIFVAKKLDEMGINAKSVDEFTDRFANAAEKTAVEVKSLGIKGMKLVGDGFIALGTYIKTEEDKPTCCGGHCH